MEIIQEDFEVYREGAKTHLGSHALNDFRKKGPFYFKKKYVDFEIEDQDSPAFLVGRAAHCLILEGENEFNARFAVGGPINPKTGESYGRGTKKFKEWLDEHGNPDCVTEADYEMIIKMEASVRAHPEASMLLADGIAEGVIRNQFNGIDCQIRMDWMSPQHGIVDLKTCDDLNWFEADAKRFGYANQGAFYRGVSGIQDFAFIAVEKKEPFRTGVWRMNDQTLGMAMQENRDAIAALIRCKQTNVWPTGYEEVRVM